VWLSSHARHDQQDRRRWRRGEPSTLRDGAARVRECDLIAQRAGETDEEIARTCGYTVPMIRAVLRST